MKKFVLSVALALTCAGSAQAALVEIAVEPALRTGTALATAPSGSDLAPMHTAQVIAPPVNMPEMPEPEVFAMMLLGLVLIGYRANRHSDEKFE